MLNFQPELFNIVQILSSACNLKASTALLVCTVTVLQDPGLYKGNDGFRAAFLRGIEEYNHYGIAVSNQQFRVGPDAALQLYGFKVAWGQAIASLIHSS